MQRDTDTNTGLTPMIYLLQTVRDTEQILGQRDVFLEPIGTELWLVTVDAGGDAGGGVLPVALGRQAPPLVQQLGDLELQGAGVARPLRQRHPLRARQRVLAPPQALTPPPRGPSARIVLLRPVTRLH